MILNLLFPEETIAYFKGHIDIYKYKNKIWIGRKWPRKVKPPYTAIQAKYQEIFSISKTVHKIFSDNVLNAWKSFKSKSLPNWYDTITNIFMNWYYKYHEYAPVVIDYTIQDSGTKKRIIFQIYYNYNKDLSGGTTIERTTEWYDTNYLSAFKNGVYITLFSDDGIRMCSPWVRLIK